VLKDFLKSFSNIGEGVSADVFGQIYAKCPSLSVSMSPSKVYVSNRGASLANVSFLCETYVAGESVAKPAEA
jgi:hypothetical protein